MVTSAGSERTVRSWVELPTKISSQRQRRDILRNWVVANGLLASVPDTHKLREEEKARVWASIYEACENGVLWSDSMTLLIHGRGPLDSRVISRDADLTLWEPFFFIASLGVLRKLKDAFRMGRKRLEWKRIRIAWRMLALTVATSHYNKGPTKLIETQGMNS